MHAYVQICLCTVGGSQKERESLEELRLDGNLLLKLLLKKQNGLLKRNKSESRHSILASCCEHGNEHLLFKNMGKIFTKRGHVIFSGTIVIQAVGLKIKVFFKY